MFNNLKNKKGERKMKTVEKIVARKLVQSAKKLHDGSIDFQSYLSVADLIIHNQYRAVQIVLEGLDSWPRDQILKVISESPMVWDKMFKPMQEGEMLALYENKTLTN
tara:strand:+ start:112 stop:432 length:321 start_codon:yes stop_codon:yes gene_type:complete